VRIVLNPSYGLLHAPVAGFSSLERATRLARQLRAEPPLVREEGPLDLKGESLWFEGLFPLMERAFVDRLVAFGRESGAAIWRSAERPELGALYLRNGLKDADRLNFADLETRLGSSPPEFRFEAASLAPLDSARSLSRLNALAFERNAGRALDAGVWLLDAARVWIEDTVQMEAGAVIGPNVYLGGATRVASGARVGMGAWLRDVNLAAGAEVKPYSVLDGADVAAGAAVGPFAHVRPGSVLEENVRVGNFVETKKVRLGAGSKASHLSYLGDADIGRDVNIGAGTITCNYDGFNKNRTVLGDRVFVGSASQFVAPVTVGDDALIGAGSTVTDEAPAGALVLARARQVNKQGGAARVRERARSQRDAAAEKTEE